MFQDISDCILIIILIIITSILIIFYTAPTIAIIGGAVYDKVHKIYPPVEIDEVVPLITESDEFALISNDKRIMVNDLLSNNPDFSLDNTTNRPMRKLRMFIPDNEKLVIDGHNMIHDYSEHKHMSADVFETTLKSISDILLVSFPTQDIHIVVKNPDNYYTATHLDVLDTDYFLKLQKISKQMPKITYHLAYEKPKKKKTKRKEKHHMKGRDDYLVVYLAKDGYIISKDRFRDFKSFGSLRAFTHYCIKDGVVDKKQIIKPINTYKYLDRPCISNHFIFEIRDQEYLNDLGVKSGQIYLSNESVFGKIYFSRL